ncbi:MAG: NAD-dependent epimerase/dehydratase family protein, partial [Bacteroidia bacterium]
MNTTLITGHNGFVGSNLIQAFQNNYELLGVDIPQHDPAQAPPLPPEKSFSWDQLHELPKVNTIIHLAGKAHDTANVSAPEIYFEVNLGLTKRIFDHFLQSKATTFIFFSSVKAVADTLEGETLTEDHKADPQTPYGQSKLAAEQYIINKIFENGHENTPLNAIDFSESSFLRKSGKRVFILRPAMIHGPGNKGNLNLLYKVVQKGIPWPLGAFNNQRSFASIDNVAYLLRHIIEKPVAPGIYNLADDQPLATNRLIGLMAESLNRKTRIWNMPPGLIKLLARTGDILHLPLNSERLKKLTESYVVSNARIKNAL